ncbi:MAG: hypothetical protein RIS82_177 [Actinomycetota bacterium]|jgi:histidine triad (HIT) family protein
MSDCIFCKIARQEIPATVVAETELSLAFWDVAPKQPIHILVIPKAHHANVSELASESPNALVDLVQLGSTVAKELSQGSFRLTFNSGSEAGQTVFHAHGHITSVTPKEQVA